MVKHCHLETYTMVKIGSCRTGSSHYLNQWWYISKGVLWHSEHSWEQFHSKSSLTVTCVRRLIFDITTASAKDGWVECDSEPNNKRWLKRNIFQTCKLNHSCRISPHSNFLHYMGKKIWVSWSFLSCVTKVLLNHLLLTFRAIQHLRNLLMKQ